MKTKIAILRLKRHKWKEFIAEQEASGSSVPAYCLQRGINEKTFYNWRKRLGCAKEPKPKRFIQIKTMENGPGKILRIQTPSGYRLEVTAGIEKGHVQSILEVLAGLG